MGITLPPGRLTDTSPLRFWLGQLGQSASPLQGAWIIGQLAEKVTAFAPHLGLINAEDALMMVKQAAIAGWKIHGDSPPPSMRRVPVKYQFWSFYDDEDDARVTMVAEAQTTQANVVAAECRLQGYHIPRDPRLVDVTGFAIEAEQAWPAHPMSLRATRELERIHANYIINLEIKQTITTEALALCTMPPGARLFEALRTLGLPVMGTYMDKYGRTWHLDELLGLCPLELVAHKVNNELVHYGGVITDQGEWIEVYNQRDHGDYIEWRMHVVTTNQLAMGHDEVWLALQQLQTWEGVPCFPPMRLMDDALMTFGGDRVAVQVPTEAVGMILKDQHWVAFRLLHVRPYWSAQLYGCKPTDDLTRWSRALKAFVPGLDGEPTRVQHHCG